MDQLAKSVAKINRQLEARRPRNYNSGDTVEVDYFALVDLLSYYKETKKAAYRVIIARDALSNMYDGDGGLFFARRRPAKRPTRKAKTDTKDNK